VSVNINIMVVCDVTPCSLGNKYQCCGQTCSSHQL